MNQVVRRTSESIALAENPADALPARVHSNSGLSVTSNLSLGIDPKLRLAWQVDKRAWEAGYSLLVFHSMGGFSKLKHTPELADHGNLIIETMQDGSYELRPPEGTHFYTFVLQRQYIFGMLRWTRSVVRFSETVPTAKVAIGRIKDKMELQDLLRRHQLDDINFEADVNEAKIRRHQSAQRLAALNAPVKRSENAADKTVAEEIGKIDAILSVFVAKRRKVEELKKDPLFKDLPKPQQKDLLEEIERRLDVAELSARQEMHRS
jgi:hypothetical protein